VRNSAAVIAESGNLLMMPGRAFDQDQWMKDARSMIDAAMTAREAAEAKDVPALFDAGGAVYEACTACHSKYALGLKRTDGEPIAE
jgi:cytochrome c5